MVWRQRAAAVCLGLAALLTPGGARADCGSPATTTAPPSLCRNGFSIDLYQGPVLAPSRVIALGGAFAALASGVDGLGQNAASAGVRTPNSFNRLDYDLSLSVSLPGAFGKTDFDNRGTAGLNSTAFFYTAGAQVQWDTWGVAVLGDFQRYSLAPAAGSSLPPAAVGIARLRVAAGALALGNQVTVGAGLRALRLTVEALPSGTNVNHIVLPDGENLLSMVGLAPEVGVVIHPDELPWRVGLSYRAPVTATGSPDARVETGPDGLRRAAGLVLPERVRLPWEVEAGVALSAGPRPLNPHWIDPREHEALARRRILEERREREGVRALELAAIADPEVRERRRATDEATERYVRADEERRFNDMVRLLEEERRARYDNWPRARILILADGVLTGTTRNGLGLQSFLRQEDVVSGDRVSFQPRLGFETEPIVNRLVTRVGSYLEPTRYRRDAGPGILSGSRQHFTFGVELRTFAWDGFGLARLTKFTVRVVGDIAPRYQNFGLSVGTWH